jgi:hypothetical protein
MLESNNVTYKHEANIWVEGKTFHVVLNIYPEACRSQGWGSEY